MTSDIGGCSLSGPIICLGLSGSLHQELRPSESAMTEVSDTGTLQRRSGREAAHTIAGPGEKSIGYQLQPRLSRDASYARFDVSAFQVEMPLKIESINFGFLVNCSTNIHYTLYVMHYMVYMIPFRLCGICYTLYIMHYALCILHYIPLYMIHHTLYIMNYRSYIIHYTLYIIQDYILYIYIYV